MSYKIKRRLRANNNPARVSFWAKHLGPNAAERENIKLDGLEPEVLVWTRPDQKLFGPDAYGPTTRSDRNISLKFKRHRTNVGNSRNSRDVPVA